MQTDGKQLVDATVTPAKALLSVVWPFAARPTVNLDPSGANDLTRKSYVDALVSAAFSNLDVKDASRLATAAALPACTAAGTGVGKTLTGNATGTLTVDGVLTVLNDRILVKNQVSGADNGIYKVTTAGAVGVAFVLTRAVDADQDAEVTQGLFTLIVLGTANAGFGFYLTTAGITVDTTSLTFAQFTPPSTITFGTDVQAAALATSNGSGTTVAHSNHTHDTPVLDPDSTNQAMAALATTTPGDQATSAVIANDNALGSLLVLTVNGSKQRLGNGTKVGVDAYISGDSGSTARAFNAVVAGDTIHWNGNVALFELGTNDILSLDHPSFAAGS